MADAPQPPRRGPVLIEYGPAERPEGQRPGPALREDGAVRRRAGVVPVEHRAVVARGRALVAHHQRHRANLELGDGEIATKHEHKYGQHTHQGGDTEVHDVGAEHVAIFGLENRSTRRALLLQAEPVLKNVAAGTKGTMPHKRTTNAGEEPGHTVA